MAFIFTARAFGYLVGSLFGGVLFDLFNAQFLLFCVLSLAALATTLVPWCNTLLVLSLMIAVHGITAGVLDTGRLSTILIRYLLMVTYSYYFINVINHREKKQR